MKNIFLLSFFFTFIFFSCDKEDDDTTPPADTPAANPVACFTVNKNISADTTEMFSFTNCSQNAVRYEWDFGDATYAPVANPNHYYNRIGEFIVRMNAYNTDDVMSSFTDTILIGHYSLDKIIYRQTSTRFMTPFILRFVRVGYFGTTATLNDQSQLPLTIYFPDSSVYDLYPNSSQYLYKEDSASMTIFNSIDVYANSIINNQLDTFISFGIYDTAKFTLQYKIVNR